VGRDGHLRHEVLLGWQELKGQGILLVDAVLDGGVTQPFLLRRRGESRDLEPDYFGFRTASNQLWVAYGLAARNGTGINPRELPSGTNLAARNSGKGRKKNA